LPPLDFPLSQRILYNLQPFCVGLPTSFLPSDLLINISLVTLVWSVLITFPNHPNLYVPYQISFLLFILPFNSWPGLIPHTLCSVTGQYTSLKISLPCIFTTAITLLVMFH
jgi:hypothetical protein